MSSNINRNKKVSLTESAETFQPRKVLLLLLLSFYNSIVAINHTLPTFQGYTPHYFCQVDNVSATVEGCVKEMNTSVQTKEPSCPQSYQFESERGDWTIVTEWQLVCERRYLRPMIATVYFCGVTIGAFICGFLADRYGRRIILLSCLYTQGILGLSLYFITSLEAFMALRFVQGFFLQGLQGTTFALLIELFPPKSRTAVAVVIDIYWPLGLMFLAGASYCIPQWRPLQLLLSAPTAATLFYMCLVPESPRWLATHPRRQETTALWSKIICADQKMSLDRNSLKTVQLCNEIGHSDNKKELVSKVLEKNESIYKHQNIITKENSDSECNENIKPCITDANDLERKIYIKVTDSPSGSNENSTCGVTEQTPNEDLMAKKISNDAESREINQESNNPDLKLTVNNGSCLLDNEHYYMKDGAHGSIFTKSSGTCDDPACLWKEIINELGYDIDKTLSDIQESCKKTVQTYPTEETLDNAKCIRVEVNTRDDGSGALQAATSNNASGVSKGMVGAKCKVVHEINQNFNVGNEELVTDLDDNTTDERETGKPLIFCNNEEKSSKENNQANILDLFRSDVLRKYNLIMMLVWFSVAISYYGIMFYLPGLSGERHLNFFLSALLELLSFVLVYFILSRFGRRLPMSTFLFVTSFSCLTVGAISVIPEEDVPWIGHVQTVLALLGKSGALACFCTMFLYASELFPTVVRAVAMGHFGFWARVGSLLSPQLIFLGEYTLPAIPLIIIGVMGMLSGISIFALPETLGKQLPDTIEEAELLAHEKKKIKKLFT